MAVVATIALLPREAQAYDTCDNALDIENGEPPGPFFGLEYALIAHALAEKFCGAPAIPMAPRFLAYAEKQGCGPDTPIYTTLKTSIEELEAADLEGLASDGKPSVQLSARDVQEWAPERWLVQRVDPAAQRKKRGVTPHPRPATPCCAPSPPSCENS
jgi:hypothetical protein